MNTISNPSQDSNTISALESELASIHQSVNKLAVQCFQTEQALCKEKLNNRPRKQLVDPFDVTVYFDTGDGFNEYDTINVRWKNDKTSIVFTLPYGTKNIRIDPEDSPCMVQNLEFSPELKLTGVCNGMILTPVDYLFLEKDPGLCFAVKNALPGGVVAFTFYYTPLALSQVPSVSSRIGMALLEYSRKVIQKLRVIASSLFRKLIRR